MPISSLLRRWLRLARTYTGKLPLDDAISNILKDYSLIVALLPLADVEGLSGKGRPGKWSRPGPYTPPSGKKGKYGKGAGGGKGFDSCRSFVLGVRVYSRGRRVQDRT